MFWNEICLAVKYKNTKLFFLALGTGHGWKGFYPTSLSESIARGTKLRPHDVSFPVKYAFVIGEYLDRNYQNRFYGKAQNLGRKLSAAYDAVLKYFDVLVMPTLVCKAMPLPTVNHTLGGNVFLVNVEVKQSSNKMKIPESRIRNEKRPRCLILLMACPANKENLDALRDYQDFYTKYNSLAR